MWLLGGDPELASMLGRSVMKIKRRDLLRGAVWAGAAVVAGTSRRGEARPEARPGTATKGRAPGDHQVVPLPADPKKLRGLSDKLIRSHHDKNYAGAVRNLNKVELDLAALPADAPGYRVAGLRQRELVFRNSVVLHELYFANLWGSGEPGGAIATALGTAFGDRAGFEERFRATANSLSGGSGWAFLSYDLHDDALRIQWAGDHSQAFVEAEPLLVLDMYEHSYHMDYGAAAAKYVEAFMRNVNWETVGQRYESALQNVAQRRARG